MYFYVFEMLFQGMEHNAIALDAASSDKTVVL